MSRCCWTVTAGGRPDTPVIPPSMGGLGVDQVRVVVPWNETYATLIPGFTANGVLLAAGDLVLLVNQNSPTMFEDNAVVEIQPAGAATIWTGYNSADNSVAGRRFTPTEGEFLQDTIWEPSTNRIPGTAVPVPIALQNPLNPNRGAYWFDDNCGGSNDNEQAGGENGWSEGASGSTGRAESLQDELHPGVQFTGGSQGAFSNQFGVVGTLEGNNFPTNGVEWIDEVLFRTVIGAGVGASTIGWLPKEGIPSVAPGAFMNIAGLTNTATLITRNGGGTTSTGIGTFPGLTWIRLIQLSKGDKVRWIINGTLVGTHTTNIPSGTSEQVLASFRIDNSSGTRQIQGDYWRNVKLFQTDAGRAPEAF